MNAFNVYNQLAVGYCRHLEISDVVRSLPQFFEGYGVLITCVDSNTEVAETLDIEFLKRHNGNLEIAVLGDLLYIPEYEISKLVDNGWQGFYGFDEIFLVPVKPSVLLSSYSFGFCSTGFQMNPENSPGFFDTFKGLGAIRYLADGCGLTFACEVEWAEHLITLEEERFSGDPDAPPDRGLPNM